MKKLILSVVLAVGLLVGCSPKEEAPVEEPEVATSYYQEEDGKLVFTMNREAEDVIKMLEVLENGERLTSIDSVYLENLEDGPKFTIMDKFTGVPNSFFKGNGKDIEVRYWYYNEEHKKLFRNTVNYKYKETPTQ